MEVIVVPKREQTEDNTFSYFMTAIDNRFVNYEEPLPVGWFRISGISKEWNDNSVATLKFTIKNIFPQVKGISKLSKNELCEFLETHVAFE